MHSRHLAVLALILGLAASLPGRIAYAEVTPSPAAATPASAASVIHAEDGDTLSTMLTRAGVSAVEAQEAVDALGSLWNPRNLQIGQEIAVTQEAGHLRELRLSASLERVVVVTRRGDGHFLVNAQSRPLTRSLQRLTGTVNSSLFEAATTAGVPSTVLGEMIRAFSYDVDFQREVQPGDSFEVMFERIADESGKTVGNGAILYAAMTLSGSTLRIYRFAPAGGIADFYSEKGESVRKPLLRTPVDGARLSSRFGMRRHPILGYTKMHRGVDFAAPRGTPVMAAGDGVVETAGPHGSYGNFIILRHAGAYETAYAHLSGFAHGLRSGLHIHQGTVIGYVGATGRATGPHLHYEVRVHGQQINPMKIRMLPARQLAGRDLTAFRAQIATVDRQLVQLQRDTVAASAPRPQ